MTKSAEVEAGGFESVVDWGSHNPVPQPVNDDFGPAKYAQHVSDITSDPQFRLAAALACVAFMVAAFDLLKSAPGM